jgi:EAL domain-containing protein (putative c-di-GMP-specific phosphodiesterase class I)
VSPAEFIPLAEDIGLIDELGTWVLRQSCQQLSTWRRTVPFGEELSVAVNLSARQLRNPTLKATIAAALADSGLPADALCLELTESLLMEDPHAAADTLASIKELGVRLSIDDFGTGYSSLSYLKRFPVDYVKIDRSFVEGLDGPDCPDQSLVAAIIAMAHALGMRTVAEGVEVTEHARRLRALSCDRAQGYLYARPLPAEQVPATLERIGTAATVLLSESVLP